MFVVVTMFNKPNGAGDFMGFQMSDGGMKTLSEVKALDVLIVDGDEKALAALGDHVKSLHGRVRVAGSVEQAALEMKRQPADIVMVNVQINDNAGFSFLSKVRNKYPKVSAVALSRSKAAEVCLSAWRAGASDLLVAPFTASDLTGCLERLKTQRALVQKLQQRNARLRHVCKRLNTARHEISQQVDLLCNDLVKAYQDIAQQLNYTQITGEYEQAVQDELEVEGLLRRTMEWLLKKLGPVNAAIYLPDADQRFALGAYLNLDTEAEAKLVETIGATLVTTATESNTACVVEDDKMIEALFGGAGRLLRGRSWLTCAARGGPKGETLGVLVVFRKQGELIEPHMRQVVESIAPILAAKIQQALELYERLNPEEGDTELE